MIVDRIQNYQTYCGAVPGLREGMAFVKTLTDQPVGTYSNPDYPGMFAMVQEGPTCEIGQNRMESHRRRLDVQLLLDGQEAVEWEEISGLTPDGEYDPEKDFAFYHGGGRRMELSAGMFYILFPQDGHRCCGRVTGEAGEHYRKIGLKLPVEEVR